MVEAKDATGPWSGWSSRTALRLQPKVMFMQCDTSFPRRLRVESYSRLTSTFLDLNGPIAAIYS